MDDYIFDYDITEEEKQEKIKQYKKDYNQINKVELRAKQVIYENENKQHISAMKKIKYDLKIANRAKIL